MIGIFFGILALAAAAQARKPVTLDAILTPARPAGLLPAIWAPDGKSYLSVRGTKIFRYEIATRQSKEILDRKPLEDKADTPREPEAFVWRNRGVREQAVQWSSDGAKLLLAVKGDLFLHDLGSRHTGQLTKTPGAEADPKLSPDGKRVAFRRAHDLYVMDVSSKKLTRLTRDGSHTRWNGELDWVYPEELALPTAYWWSPDGKRIAYLQFDVSPILLYPHADLLKLRPVHEPERYPQAGTPNARVRLGIVSSTGGKTKWAPLPGPEDQLAARVTWLPDSSEVAVHLLTRVQNKLTLAAAGGARPRVILEQDDPAWVNLKDDFLFLKKSRRFIWGAERPNYRHLYLHSLDGGEPVRITQGDWEVTDLACVDEEAERVYFTSTEASPVERHLYVVNFNGSDRKKLSEDKGTHSVSFAPGCGHYLASHSSIAQPPRQTLQSAGGALVAELAARDAKTLEEYEILPAELLTFQSSGALFHARLIKPAQFDPARKYPAIVQVYGGPHAQTVRDSWRGLDWDQFLAHQGFVIWQMDNRGSAGRGHDWERPLYRRFGRQELADQIEGVKHLVSLGFVDPARVGINGWSYGGYMTLYSLFNAPETFHAGISGAPVTDWRHYDTIYTERYMGLPQQNEAGYKESSPVHQAANLKGKLMLIHNYEDDNVLFQHTLRMTDALQRANKKFDFLLYPQKSHGVGGPVRRHMYEAMTEFFRLHLRPGS